MAFTIGTAEVVKRRKNIFLGLFFSVGLILLTGLMNGLDAGKYNDLLLASVVFFLVFANIINGFRYIQWLKLIKEHRIEERDGALDFFKGESKSTLKPENIHKIDLQQKKGELVAITIRLNIGNKIRLEGYDDMDGLLAALKKITQEGTLIT
ncbi:MAG: hypothetical protein HQL72_03265 [Magnetococcales bacterium]|nr:hypothetical protein [Magnetococcales bacterium]